MLDFAAGSFIPSQYLSACAVQATDFITEGVVAFGSPEIDIHLHLTTEFVRSSTPIARHSRLASSMMERPRIQAGSPHMRIRCACFDKRASHPYLRNCVAKSTYSVSQAQSALPRLIRDVESGELVSISRHDETVAYLLSRDHLEAIVETMELLANPRARTAIADHRRGRLKLFPLSTIDRD
jgi:PHD/YefM family antitoxin component YafN of YafNO toxin-antitoxin module